MKKSKVIIAILIIVIVVVGVIYISCRIKKDTVANSVGNENLTEEQAIQKAKEIAEKSGKTFGNVVEAKFDGSWNINTDNNIHITIDSKGEKSFSLFDTSVDDTKIASTMTKSEVQDIANKLFIGLGYNEEEYKLKSLEKNGITDDTNLWGASFCKVYDGVYNKYESVNLMFIPEIEWLKSYNFLEYKTENNSIEISKEEAIEVAKNKAKELNKDESRIKEITAELNFEKTNSNKEDVVRKIWEVRIEYDSEFVDIQKVSVDCTTGEIINHDST